MYKRKNSGKDKGIFYYFLSSLSLTTWIIIVNVIVFISAVIILKINSDLEKYIFLYPMNIMSGKYLWTLVTHFFMHGGALHLFLNMFVLFSLGGLTEKIIGRKRFFWFYMISGIFAGFLSVLLSYYFGQGKLESVFGSPFIPMVGASGAIFAIAGLFIILLPRIKFSIIFLPFFSLPGYIMVPLFLFVVWVISIFSGLQIGNVAHFGGFIVGIIYGFYLRTKYKRKVKMLQSIFRSA